VPLIFDAKKLVRAPVRGRGDMFSVADIAVEASVFRWYALDIVHPVLPNVRRWYEELTERPAFRSVVVNAASQLRMQSGTLFHQSNGR